MKCCLKCGKQVGADMKFCPECGASIPTIDKLSMASDKTYLPNNENPSLASEKTFYGEALSETEDLIGEMVAFYQIKEKIGQGGMGVVYKAVHPKINKTVAIKFLAPAFSTSKRFIARFEREARAMAGLNHRNIVGIQNMGEFKGRYFLIMEYIPGRTVAEILQDKGRLVWQEVVRISEQVLQALKTAHAQGLLHRDIKPGNILVMNDGTVKVSDFGLVKMMGIGEDFSIDEARSRMSISTISEARQDGIALTIEGSPIGTFDYMSPEQYQGESNLDERSDIFSFGMTVYKMLTGRLLRGFAKPPSKYDSAIPAVIDAMSIKCLEEDREDRYRNAGELLEVLGDIKEDLDNAGQVIKKQAEKENHPQIKKQTRQKTNQSHRVTEEKSPRKAIRDTQFQHDAVKFITGEDPRNLQLGQVITVKLEGEVTLSLVWIPPGEFLMGSHKKELGRGESETQHKVHITRGFWMGKYPVTQEQWKVIIRSNPSEFKNSITGTHPVESVSWKDCQDFLGSLSRKTTLEFDLPTEAEWEYACRAGTTNALNCSKELTTRNMHCRNLDEVAWYCMNSAEATHPVGLKKPNQWDLYDMHGNVSEWCRDWYAGYSNKTRTDPLGPSSGWGKVLRGGSWHSQAGYCRSANRNGEKIDSRKNNIGLRVVVKAT